MAPSSPSAQREFERDAIHREAIRCARGVPYETRMEPGKRGGQYVFMDPAIEDLVGLPAEGFTQDKFGELIEEIRITGENAPEDFDAYCQEVVEGRRERYMADVRIQTPQGETKWLSDCSVIVRDEESGAVIGCLGILQDVTARYQAEEERRALQVQVLEALRSDSLSVLAGGVAQDFNNLLLGILGNVDLMAEDLPTDSDLRPMLDDVRSAAQRAADLTSQMLAYVGKGAGVSESLSLPEMFESLRNELAPRLSDGKKIEMDLDPRTPAVRGDRAQVRHVLSSLLTNGIDALDASGGRVTVRTRGIHATSQSMKKPAGGTTAPIGPCALVEVTDTGTGMDADMCERIFDPFFSTKMTGRGLGLAATLGIIRRLGGCIGVTSAPGKGTSFHVLLPADQSDDA